MHLRHRTLISSGGMGRKIHSRKTKELVLIPQRKDAQITVLQLFVRHHVDIEMLQKTGRAEIKAVLNYTWDDEKRFHAKKYRSVEILPLLLLATTLPTPIFYDSSKLSL